MEGSGARTLSGAAVLIVEDDIAIVEDDIPATGMTALVEAAGGSVMALALDGRAALDILEGRRPDIALLNVGPATGSGLEVARRLRELNLPFVVIGTYSHDILSAELRDAPYLSKPCTADQILGALVDQLRASRTPLEEPPRYRPFSAHHQR
jgi:DNA-binding response OmpR family regulator